MALEFEDILTGPGLESTHSCEIVEDFAALKSPVVSNLKGPSQNTQSVLANGHGVHPAELQIPTQHQNGTRPVEGASERIQTGFEASSSRPWDSETEIEGGSPKSPKSPNHPSRAETMEEIDERLRAERRARRAERAAQISSLATLSLLFIASALFVVLAYTGWNAVAAAVALFCASIAGYPFLHLLFYGLSSQMFAKTWNRMSAVDRFKWGQKGASLVHSGIIASVGLSIVLQGSWKVKDLMAQRDDRVAAFIGLELGYLIQDTGMEAYKHFAFGRSSSALHWVHHLTLLAGLPWYYKFYQGDFFVGALFLWSTSTVPLHLRWFQAQSGMDKGIFYQLNNAALLLSFLACRIVSIPVLLHLYGCTQGWSLAEVPFRIHWVGTALCGVVMLSNTIWLAHLLKNAFKPRRRRHRHLYNKHSIQEARKTQ